MEDLMVYVKIIFIYSTLFALSVVAIGQVHRLFGLPYWSYGVMVLLAIPIVGMVVAAIVKE